MPPVERKNKRGAELNYRMTPVRTLMKYAKGDFQLNATQPEACEGFKKGQIK